MHFMKLSSIYIIYEAMPGALDLVFSGTYMFVCAHSIVTPHRSIGTVTSAVAQFACFLAVIGHEVSPNLIELN